MANPDIDPEVIINDDTGTPVGVTNPLPVKQQPYEGTGSGTITAISAFTLINYGSLSSTSSAAGTFADFDCSKLATLWFTITGTWTGTLYFEATQDGTNWFTIDAQMPGVTNPTAFGAGTAATGAFRINVSALSRFRVRAPLTAVTAVTSITVSFRGSAVPVPTSSEPQMVIGTSANGGVVKNNPFVIAGTANGKVAIASIDTNGVQVSQSYGEAILHGLVTGQAGKIAGRITTAATTEAAIRGSLYVEQTAGAARSVKSSSASDASAGTGIRTIRITYFTLTAGVVAGPFTEDMTLNGTTAVNTVATNICYVESIRALTVGSGGVAAGNVDLFTTTAGGGTAFARIATGDRNTRYAHHYVPTGSICNIKSLHGSSTASSGNTPLIVCRYNDPTNSVGAQVEIIDGFEVQGSQSAVQLTFDPPRAITGPAVVVFYLTPTNAASQVMKMEADFYQQ